MVVLMPFSVDGQQLIDTSVANLRITIKMQDKPLLTVFNRLINKYDITIGFEESSLDREHTSYLFIVDKSDRKSSPEYSGEKEIRPTTRIVGEKHLLTVDFDKAPLEEVIDSIVAQMKHYDWTINDGVVNIFPTKGRDPRLVKLLNTNINYFGVEAGMKKSMIGDKIRMFLPELNAFLKEENLAPELAGEYSVLIGHSPLLHRVSFSNLSFINLLNSITKEKRGGWIIKIKSPKDESGKPLLEVIV